MTHPNPQTLESADEVPRQSRGKKSTVSNLERSGHPAGCRPIAGMKRGWYYRAADRMVMHRQNAEDELLPIGQVPRIKAQIVHLTDDGEDIRSEYLAIGKRQRRARILTEDELDRGTWAAKMGMRRPTGNDERHAFARLIREEGDAAPIESARTYYDDEDNLVFPASEAQTLGYRVLRGKEEAARDAWDEIGAWTSMDGKAALVAGAYFAGPVLDTLDMLAHMVSLHGPGQQGKSTMLVVCAGCYGDIKPKRQSLWMTWNASKQGITQNLRLRGYLPLALDEHSSSGKTIKESSREISQMVSGAIRAMGTADGSPREADGFWHSVLLSSSNEPLKYEGQTEDLATRLQEFRAPFFPNKMVDAEGGPATGKDKGAEHISKRLKRLATDFGGWPLEWAIRKGMYRAENLVKLRKLHLELCAKYRPEGGGVAGTIAELHMAWVVGAHMLGLAIGVPGLGQVAEQEAAARLAEAIEISAEANIPDCERLWNALDALRIEASAFPEMDRLPAVAEEGFRRLRGFTSSEAGEWWVINPVVQEAAAQAGIDNVSAALRALDDLGVHIRGVGKHAQRQLPKALRGQGLGIRMHCFSTRVAGEVFASDEEPEDGSGGGSQTGPGSEFPCGNHPGNHPGTTGVVPENVALTSSGTTGTTGTTLDLFDFSKQEGTTSEISSGAAQAEDSTGSRVHDVTSVPPMPLEPPAVVFPAARMYQPGDARLDQEWLRLEAKAKGRTRGGIAFGVLGADGSGLGLLHLANHEPVPVALPGSVDDVPALMGAYGLKTLWVHESAALAMGLPTCEERRGLPVLGEDQDDDQEDQERVGLIGPQVPVAHPWAVPSGHGPVTGMAPVGLASWLTLICGQGEAQERLSVSLPLYDTRYDKDRRRGGFGGPATPEELLDALMVWTLSTVHGSKESPRVIPFYASVNRTAQDFAGGRERTDVICEAVRRGEVEPVIGNRVPLMVPQQWHRKLSEAEAAMVALHRFDKSAAWLGAFSNVRLGIGEPVHAIEGAQFDRLVPGFWRVAEVPGRGPEGLPELRFREADGGGFWISTPSMDLLLELYRDWTPDVLEAWFWQEHKRALEGMYTRVKDSRNYIVAAIASGRPGAKWAKAINGRTYQSFRGYLARTAGPMTDRATGGDYRKDIFYRPDWARLIMDLGTANLYRNLRDFRAAGHLPLAICVDAVTYASSESDPELARPQQMRLGSAGGQWTHEGSAPLPELLETLQAGTNPHHALTDYLKTQGE
ncbi:DUF927 domain-containing protein [Streptomyces sp. YPW6]|uniref:DUF927 domain-containing protein n=1 Tax=Streptomyces sp. YPW6 TaxID=2840373 RepID=UPI003D73BB3B